ncbi:MAG: ABC transporter ATP-binding protein [Pseudomonadota bacterium]
MGLFVESLRKSFGTHVALRDVSFDVPRGAFFCVVGPSGCGKSTLLRAIAGLETPDAGQITLDGALVFGGGTNVPPEERQVGVVFQSYALWPHLSVARNVAFPYEATGTPRGEALRLADQHLETVALSDFAQRRPDALSGGQRQRVALARCLAGQTRTILMDEPLANLDPHLRHSMEGELRAFHDRSGVTTLFITHDQREAMALADVMAVMEDGQFLQFGTPQDIYDRPASAAVARFIGRGALLEGDVEGAYARVLGQDVPVTGAGSATIFVRPQNIVADAEGVPVTLRSVLYRGGHWEVTGTAEGSEAELMFDLPAPARPGDVVPVRLTGGWVLPA